MQASAAVGSRAILRGYIGEEVDLVAFDLDTLASEPEPPAPGLHPDVRSLDAAIRASEVEAEAAYRRWVPDLELFFGYRQVTALETETGHGFALRVAMPLTFLDFGQGDAAIAEAEAASARAERSSLSSFKEAEREAAEAALAALQPSKASEEPSGNDSVRMLLEQTQKLYLADEASIAELLDAASVAESAGLAAVDLAERRALARIAKMRATGSLFDPALDRACAGSQ